MLDVFFYYLLGVMSYVVVDFLYLLFKSESSGMTKKEQVESKLGDGLLVLEHERGYRVLLPNADKGLHKDVAYVVENKFRSGFTRGENGVAVYFLVGEYEVKQATNLEKAGAEVRKHLVNLGLA